MAYARIIAAGDAEVAESLVVFQQDIVLRRMELDKACFKNKCVKLGIAHDKIEVVDHRHELVGLCVMRFDSVKI